MGCLSVVEVNAAVATSGMFCAVEERGADDLSAGDERSELLVCELTVSRRQFLGVQRRLGVSFAASYVSALLRRILEKMSISVGRPATSRGNFAFTTSVMK